MCENDKNNKLIFYLVRHGMTHFNLANRVQGFCDSPLTDFGIEQAMKTGKYLRGIEFTSCYCADLGRHRETISYILNENTNKTPKLVELYGLREWHYGVYEGGPDSEMWAPVFKKFGFDFSYEFENYYNILEILGDEGICDEIRKNSNGTAETYGEILERARVAFEYMIKDTMDMGGGNILVVSSGNILASILHMLIPKSYDGEFVGNCAVTQLEYSNDTYTLINLNDVRHLK